MINDDFSTTYYLIVYKNVPKLVGSNKNFVCDEKDQQLHNNEESLKDKFWSNL